MTTGDGSAKGSQAQSGKSLGGKILRITTDGKPAPGNPVKTSAIWSSGHRNVQGIAWDAAKRMYASESHQKTGELNVIIKGKNYGWPAADGISTNAKFANPLVTWPIEESSCAGVAVLERMVGTACLLGKRLAGRHHRQRHRDRAAPLAAGRRVRPAARPRRLPGRLPLGHHLEPGARR